MGSSVTTHEEIITPGGGTFDIAEFWRYRDLILLFVRRDFVSIYKQTILGPIWYILSPLLSTFVFTVVFGKIARLSTDGIPPFLFYFTGVICWGYFSQSLVQVAGTFQSNSGVFAKVYFPRITVPVAMLISGMFSVFIQMGMLAGLLIWIHIPLRMGILAIPSFIQLALLALGAGLCVCSVTTRYRDLNHLFQLGVQLWMFLTPVVYPASQVPSRFRDVYLLNPVAVAIEEFRFGVLGVGEVRGLGLSWILTTGILALGIFSFLHVERKFIDTI